MRAVIQNRYGNAEVLKVADAALHAPRSGEVAIKVHASAVHQGNVLFRSGDYPRLLWLPMRLMFGILGPRKRIPGTVFAGRVEAVGEGVRRFEVGQDVAGVNLHGAHAESIVVPETGTLALIPEGIDYADAASVLYGGTTARYFLLELGELEAGQRVLVIGASGGVGQAMVQVAVASGAEVTAVSTSRSAEFVRSLGAHHLVDRHKQPIVELDETFDLIVDTAGVARFPTHQHLLSAHGRLLAVHTRLDLLWWAWRTRNSQGKRLLTGMSMGSPEELAAVFEQVESGAIRPLVARRYPLEHIVQAHHAVESGDVRGSVILEPCAT